MKHRGKETCKSNSVQKPSANDCNKNEGQKTKFYAQDELNDLYKEMKRKTYQKKEPWEKFINDSDSSMKKKQKRNFEKEISLEYLQERERSCQDDR